MWKRQHNTDNIFPCVFLWVWGWHCCLATMFSFPPPFLMAFYWFALPPSIHFFVLFDFAVVLLLVSWAKEQHLSKQTRPARTHIHSLTLLLWGRPSKPSSWAHIASSLYVSLGQDRHQNCRQHQRQRRHHLQLQLQLQLLPLHILNLILLPIPLELRHYGLRLALHKNAHKILNFISSIT